MFITHETIIQVRSKKKVYFLLKDVYIKDPWDWQSNWLQEKVLWKWTNLGGNYQLKESKVGVLI